MTMSERTPSMQVPDLGELSSVQALFECSAPYDDFSGTDSLFIRAMGEIVQWHKKRNPFYATCLEGSDFASRPPISVEECGDIPWVLASFFKSHETLSVLRSAVKVSLTSSGTTGQKSQVFFDEWSLGAPQVMIDRIFGHYGWVTKDTPVDYLLYTYESEPDTKLGTSATDHYLCKFAPAKNTVFALKRNGSGGHDFDVFGTIASLKESERSGRPLRIFGFPAFLHFTLKKMKDLGERPLRLSPESLIFLGGGWKGYAGQGIHKRELYANVTAMLGIPDERLRDGFGSVEHCIPYIECRNHNFHVPIWSRVFIRDLKTLKVLPEGENGFLHFLTPFATSMPNHSVLMGDLASLHSARECGCDVRTPYFKVHGRAGTSKNKSCAIAAAELLSRETIR